MDKRKKLRRIAVAVLVGLTAVLPPLLYSFLIRRGLEGAYMFGNDSFFAVGAVAALGGAGLMIALKGRDESEADASFEEEDEETVPSEAYVNSDTKEALEEYPELFSKREAAEEEPSVSVPSYYEALSRALNAQKADIEDKSKEEKAEADEVESFLSRETKKEEDEPSSLWSDLPDTLPEGYTAYEEKEDEEYEEELQSFEVMEERGNAGRMIKKAVAAVLLITVPFGFSLVMSRFRTEYYADSLKVSTLAGVEEYKWEDCESYELSPSFSGERLSFLLYMKDGKRIQLLPSDMHIVGDGFKDPYAYAVHVAKSLDSAGAEKRILEKSVLEGDLALREEMGRYVKELIED